MDPVFQEKLDDLPKCLRDVMVGRLEKHDTTDPTNQIIHAMLDKAISQYRVKKTNYAKRKKERTQIVAEEDVEGFPDRKTNVVFVDSKIDDPKSTIDIIAEVEPQVESVEPQVETRVEPVELSVETQVFLDSKKPNVEPIRKLNIVIKKDHLKSLFKESRSSAEDTVKQPPPQRLMQLFQQRRP